MKNRIFDNRISSFWSGVCSVADIWGEIPPGLSGPQADKIALEGDFRRIGGDLRRAISHIRISRRVSRGQTPTR